MSPSVVPAEKPGLVRRLADAWPVWLVLLLLPLFHLRVVFGTAIFPGDFTDLSFPGLAAAYRAIHTGSFPWWNPYLWGGYPAIGDQTIGMLYPPTFLTLLLPWGRELPLRIAELELIGAFATGAVFMYLLARAYSASKSGAFLAASVFTFGLFMPFHVEHKMWVPAVVWAVGCLWILKRAMTRGGYWWWLFPPALACGILAGTAESMWYAGLAIGFAWVWQLAASRPKAREAALSAAKFFGVMLLGVVCAAILILPVYDFMRQGTRGVIPYAAAAQGSFSTQWLRTLVVPWAFGPHAADTFVGGDRSLAALYTGALPLVLGLAAWFGAWRRKSDDRLLATSAVLWTVAGMSTQLPVYRVLYHVVPGLSLHRHPYEAWGIAQIFVAVLIGLGLDRIVEHDRARGWGIAMCAVGLGIGAFAIALSAGRFTGPTGQAILGLAPGVWPAPDWAARIGASAVPWLVGGIVLLLKRGSGQRWFVPVVLFLCVADLFVFNSNLAVNSWPVAADTYFTQHSVTGTPNWAVRPAQAAVGKYRLLSTDIGSFWADGPEVWRFDSTNGYLPTRYRRFGELMSLMPENHGRVLDLLGVRWIVTFDANRIASAERHHPSWTETWSWEATNVAATAEHVLTAASDRMFLPKNITSIMAGRLRPVRSAFYALYENPAAMPRAFLVHETRTLSDPAERLRYMGSAAFDPASTAVVEKPVAVASPEGTGSAEVRSRRADMLTIDVNTTAPGLLVVADIYDAAWKTSVDGRAAETLIVDHALRGVAVPAGRHVVTMAYRPPFAIAGIAVSAAAVLVCVMGVAVAVKKPGPPGARPDTEDEAA